MIKPPIAGSAVHPRQTQHFHDPPNIAHRHIPREHSYPTSKAWPLPYPLDLEEFVTVSRLQPLRLAPQLDELAAQTTS